MAFIRRAACVSRVVDKFEFSGGGSAVPLTPQARVWFYPPSENHAQA